MPTNASTPFKAAHKAPQPRREVFDPWNTASTGHQRAENRLAGSTSWRQSRTLKLNAQFGSGESDGGGRRIADTVGAGSLDFGENGRTDTGWDNTVSGWRGREGLVGQGWGDISEMIQEGQSGIVPASKKRKRQVILFQNEADDNLPPPSAQETREDHEGDPDSSSEVKDSLPIKKPTLRRSPRSQQSHEATTNDPKTITPHGDSLRGANQASQPPQIFSSLTFQINGTTYPTISDHKLKYLLTSHGANLSISHARRTVTHVIVGRPSSAASSISTTFPSTSTTNTNTRTKSLAAGGGLAGGKLEKEITMKNGGRGLSKGVKYVSVEWVMESVKAGVRLSESRFSGVSTAPKGVRSVRDMFIEKGS